MSLSVPLTGLHTSLSAALIGLSTPAETGEPASAVAEPLMRSLSGHAERCADIGPGGAERSGTGDVGRCLVAAAVRRSAPAGLVGAPRRARGRIGTWTWRYLPDGSLHREEPSAPGSEALPKILRNRVALRNQQTSVGRS